MSTMQNLRPTSRVEQLKNWVDDRLPVFTFMRHTLDEYPSPKNLNYWWNYGSLAMLCLSIMIVTGIFLAMYYTPHQAMAFDSVDRIMRDVNYGWLIRNLHMNGASMFFMIVYIHMFRGLYYGSYKAPREILWILGVVILLLMMATAFMGYVLPWGQMSFWGATVITKLFAAFFPGMDGPILNWLWGDFAVSNSTLNRFFSLHYLMPFLIIGVVALHLVALHKKGSNNPLGIDLKPQDQIPLHPYYSVKDFYGFGLFFLVYFYFVFYSPEFFNEADNYIPANPLNTPPHIVPEWYFLPYYAILRSVPWKWGGVFLMFASIMILFVLPWLDRSKVRSATFRPIFKKLFWVFAANCIILGYIGALPPDAVTYGIPNILIGRIATFYYFAHFLCVIPLLAKYEKTLPLPESLSKPVLGTAAIKSVVVFMMVMTSFTASASGHPVAPKKAWSFDGFFGTYDRASLQRGFQVYNEVCASCHSLNRVAYRHLEDIGIPKGAVKALAAAKEFPDTFNEEGEFVKRPGKPSDRIAGPYLSEKQARASNNGSLPPDLSLMTKARVGGSNYVFAYLTGYAEAPSGFTLMPAMHYNQYFAGFQTAMAPPLSENRVTYADGTPATVEQMAKDVTAFLQWSADPKMEERKRIGFKVMLFMFFFTILLYFSKRKLWQKVK